MAKQTKNVSSGGESFMVKLSTFIVDKRNLFFLITIILVIFSMFSRNWVEVENDLTFYLPEDSETKKALNVMDGEFTTYGTAEVMVANIAYEDAERMLDDLKQIKGVQSIDFDDTTDHYNNASALYSITFNYDETDDACLESLDKVKEYLSGQDIYVKTDLGNTQAETIEREINMIMVYVAIVIVAVLLFTSETYGEIPVLILTFGVGMIVNQGTNYLLGKISFVSNSVTSILQLALSIDYAIIFCNRFKEEHKSLPIREAVILALSKSIPEIGASSLTTIGGLVAMLFMQFRLRHDMAICLIKSIGFALLSAFVVMPGLLVLFGPLIDRTGHKNFVPKISFIGSYDYATRHIVPIIFIVVLFFAFRLSNDCPYAYGYSVLSTPKLNETQIAENMIEDNFSSSNMMALVVPRGDYEKEAQLLKELESYDEVDYTMGLANIDALDGYKLADKLTPRQFAELAGLDYEAAQVVYAAYAAENESYGELVGNIATYKVPLIDMFLYVCDKVDSGVVTLSDEQTDMLHDAEVQMTSAKNQLQGETYTRMLLYLTLPVSGDETYHFTDKILEIARSYYPDEDVFLAGNSTNEYDFEKSFAVDNTVVSIVSVRHRSGGAALYVQLRRYAAAADPRHSGQYLDQLLVPDDHGKIPLLPWLSGRQLHPDGREHRLRDRHRQPLSGAESENDEERGDHRYAELRVPDDHYLGLDSCHQRLPHWQPHLRARHRRHRRELRPRHGHFNLPCHARPAADPADRHGLHRQDFVLHAGRERRRAPGAYR